MSKKNNRLNIVYSTNPNFEYEYEDTQEIQTLKKTEQKLRVSLDKKARKGKEVTLIEGFIGQIDDLKDLEKMLKAKCGVGGTTKDNCILIQGNFREKIVEILKTEGYKVNKN